MPADNTALRHKLPHSTPGLPLSSLVHRRSCQAKLTSSTAVDTHSMVSTVATPPTTSSNKALVNMGLTPNNLVAITRSTTTSMVATTNISSNQLNLITEFIGGYAFLGRPLANMIFKFYGYVAVSQGLE